MESELDNVKIYIFLFAWYSSPICGILKNTVSILPNEDPVNK